MKIIPRTSKESPSKPGEILDSFDKFKAALQALIDDYIGNLHVFLLHNSFLDIRFVTTDKFCLCPHFWEKIAQVHRH